MNHEPCGLLGYPKTSSYFAATNSILAINEHPESSHPLIKSERRIFEDHSELERELLLTRVAKPDTARLDERVLLGAASWTGNLAIWPTEFLGILESAFWFGEVNDGFLDCLGSVHA